MGRTRTKTRKNDLLASTSKVSSEPTEEPPLESLLEKAGELLVQTDFELCARFLDRILRRAPHHAAAKELLGVLQLETGDLDSARSTFSSLIPPSPHAPPDAPSAAHLYLAQLSDEDPHAALSHYDAAVNILEEKLKDKGKGIAVEGGEELDEEEVKATIVRALIGSVEVWMDPSYDLCFDPAAENTCEALLSRALNVSPGNAEALQALASVRMSQSRPDDAKALLEQSWSSWKDLESDDPALPPLQTRISLAKIFLELELYNPSLEVIQGILAADDTDAEAWYLEGWAHFLIAESLNPDPEWIDEAREARDSLESCLALHVAQDHPDMPLRDHARELVEKLEALGVKASPEGEEEGEEGWEDDIGSEDGDGDVEMA
ncbi:TPR-like protein [Peniophora sp. CONT]|nr:TPR-like protein [Peniophora sp. CONT]